MENLRKKRGVWTRKGTRTGLTDLTQKQSNDFLYRLHDYANDKMCGRTLSEFYHPEEFMRSPAGSHTIRRLLREGLIESKKLDSRPAYRVTPAGKKWVDTDPKLRKQNAQADIFDGDKS